MAKFLVIGAFGQIGSELVPALQKKYGLENVVAAGHSHLPLDFKGLAEKAEVTKPTTIAHLVEKYQIETIINFASFLSVKSEEDPQGAWEVNLIGLKNVLDICQEKNLKLFWPSSIAAFGPTTPKENTPQDTLMEPTAMYGVSKRAGELLCQYYFLKYQVDVRSVRYPGLLDYKTPPSQGTTEYAKHIFYAALEKGEYLCPLRENTVLPMMYMEDAIRAALMLMEKEKEKVKIRTSYNLAAFSFAPQDIYEEIKKYLPEFKITYQPNPQIQKIADSWPSSIDDRRAREDWDWQPKYGLRETVRIMFEKIKKRLNK